MVNLHFFGQHMHLVVNQHYMAFNHSTNETSCGNIRRSLTSCVSIIKKCKGKTLLILGGSPGLVVKGGDSCSEGRSWIQIPTPYGHISHLFVVKIVMFV